MAGRPLNVRKNALILNYENLAGKYRQQRDLSDSLLEPVVGGTGWRDHLRMETQVGRFKAVACVQYRALFPNVGAKLFDYMWNRIDQTHYLHWSVYHIGWEWLIAPDALGRGGLNLALQEVPLPPHGGRLDGVFASWDDPAQYASVPADHEYAMLMRFWAYAADVRGLKLLPLAMYLGWNATADGGTELFTVPLTIDPAHQQECTAFKAGDLAGTMPHEWEESSSWTMAALDLARRRGFDPDTYQPVWARSGPRTAAEDRDPGHLHVHSSAELDALSFDELDAAYAALWQKYLAAKMTSDYLLRYSVRQPSELSAPSAEIYKNFFVPAEHRAPHA